MDPSFIGLLGMKLPRLKWLVHMRTVCGTLHGILLVIFFAGYGEQSPALAGRSTGTFPLPEAPTTPGPFAAGLTRNERTIPGIGVAMPLSLPSFDAADQGEQRLPVPGMMPVAAPPLPPGLHASVLAASGQQAYQQIPQQFPPPQQQSALPQQMGSLLLAPPNLVQLQPPGHLPLLPHPHLPRPPPPIGMPSSMPQMQPSQMGIQGSANQMIPPLPQSHLMGMNPMHSGPLPTSSISPPVESFINGIANTQGSSTGAQTFPYGGMFNRTQSGQLGSVPGLGTYQ